MGPIARYLRLVVILVVGAIVLVVTAINTPQSYILIPLGALALWFSMIMFLLADIRCSCGWRIEDGMPWIGGRPNRECPSCGRDLSKP